MGHGKFLSIAYDYIKTTLTSLTLFVNLFFIFNIVLILKHKSGQTTSDKRWIKENLYNVYLKIPLQFDDTKS